MYMLWTMKHKTLRLFALLLVGALAFAACEPEETTVVVDEDLLIGTWYAADNFQEYWRYDMTHTGETWDVSEDVQEGEGTRFKWSTTEDQLRIDLFGQMGQHVYYDYTVTDQKASSLTWRDSYGNSRTFYRK